jgi:hypothetical protein
MTSMTDGAFYVITKMFYYMTIDFSLLLNLLITNIDRPNPKSSIWMFIPDSLLITLSPLLFKDDFHLSFGMFDDGSGDANGTSGDGRVPT